MMPCTPRTLFSLAFISTLALSGCSKTADQTQNPDEVAGEGSGAEGVEGAEGEGKVSRARGSSSTRGAGRKTVGRTIKPKKGPRVIGKFVPGGGETPSEEGPNGLVAEAYMITAPEGLPEDFGALEVAESFTIPNLDVDETDFTSGFPGAAALEQNYALRFVGSINITEEAEYELCLHSDDGSQLLLEDTLVVDNDGVHDAPVEACELVFLAPGEYRLEVRYFQAAGPSLALHFAWSVNGGEKVIVPTEVLFKPETAPDSSEA